MDIRAERDDVEDLARLQPGERVMQFLSGAVNARRHAARDVQDVDDVAQPLAGSRSSRTQAKRVAAAFSGGLPLSGAGSCTAARPLSRRRACARGKRRQIRQNSVPPSP